MHTFCYQRHICSFTNRSINSLKLVHFYPPDPSTQYLHITEMKNILLKIRSFFYLLPNIVEALFSKPETIAYPRVSHNWSASYRGSVHIITENCIGCGLCVRDCPAAALALEKNSKTNFRLIYYRDRCTSCGQCELSCKYNSIYLDNTYKDAFPKRKDFYEVLVNKT